MSVRKLSSPQVLNKQHRAADIGRAETERSSAASNGGRPRSEASRVALLETAYGLMKKHSLAAITTQQIAAQASVSTATVYRWWDTKEALLVDAFLHVKQQNVRIADTGSPLHRIREHAVEAGKFLEGEHGLVAARLLAAIQDDPNLRDHFLEKFYVPHSSEMMELARQAVKAGELPPKTNIRLFLDIQFGACMTRLLLRHEPIRGSDYALAFDIAVAGAREYWGKR